MLRELQGARSHLYHWALAYEAPLLAGELTIDESVDRYLRSL
jgi:hypothetical protein